MAPEVLLAFVFTTQLICAFHAQIMQFSFIVDSFESRTSSRFGKQLYNICLLFAVVTLEAGTAFTRRPILWECLDVECNFCWCLSMVGFGLI